MQTAIIDNLVQASATLGLGPVQDSNDWQQDNAGKMSYATKAHEGPAWLEGKDTRITVLSKEPLVLETPVSLLAGQRITGKQFLFVRNIQDLAQGLTLEPMPIEGWEFELVGLVNPSRVVIRAEDLLAMDQVKYDMVLQCSGNGRSQYPGIPGTPWGQGGVANIRFAGAPLSTESGRRHRQRRRVGCGNGGAGPDRPPRPGASPFARDDLTRETAQKLYDGSDFQRPVGFEPQDRRGVYHHPQRAAAASPERPSARRSAARRGMALAGAGHAPQDGIG